MVHKSDKQNNSSSPITSSPILGTYEGECADANITNLNGLDITRPVWENVFSSEDYKKAIKLGWYIGFLGHPEDPNCMDFEHACIVMTDGWIDAQGKVHGRFNLIDTPVGRIVYAFQEAGVIFGISVRGAGDIIANSVDPETFIFRGFDLVTFPAFPDSIPTFTKIAAATDAASRMKYQKVCSAVNNNLDAITSIETLNLLQSQFASQSSEYAAIENRISEILSAKHENHDSILSSKLEAMTAAYIEATARIHELALENETLKIEAASIESTSKRKLKSIERIVSSQKAATYNKISALNKKYSTAIAANSQLKRENSELQNSNLKYKLKIAEKDEIIADKDRVISSMEVELAETVNGVETSNSRASNLDEELKRLRKQIKSSTRLQEEYRDAYAVLYASAAGVDLSKVSITSDMSVKDVQNAICGSCNISTFENNVEPVYSEDVFDEESLVTL